MLAVTVIAIDCGVFNVKGDVIVTTRWQHWVKLGVVFAIYLANMMTPSLADDPVGPFMASIATDCNVVLSDFPSRPGGYTEQCSGGCSAAQWVCLFAL